MAGRFVNPFPQFFDSTPDVYNGGKLMFEASGTSTPLDTYTDQALTIPNTNPVILDAAGRSATSIFLQDLEYKVTLKDANDVTIWTADPISCRDGDLVAKTLTGSGSPNGAVAGTAGSASILPDFYWDYTNKILYVCTTTGTTSTAIWTAVNASSAASVVVPPQGYLTLASGQPVLTTDVTGTGIVYYTPDTGTLVPIYNGSSFVPITFAELILTLSSANAGATIYDVFVYSNSGVLTLVTGPAWAVSTPALGSRGTGAGTTQLSKVSGILVNTVQITGRNGANTYTVPASQGTYLGSIYIDGNAGQTSCHLSYGQGRKWGVWNCYNRKPIRLRCGDNTASWSYNTTSFRSSNGTANNVMSIFTGLAEEASDIFFTQRRAMANASTISINAIGYSSTTTASGVQGLRGTGSSTGADFVSEAHYISTPNIGVVLISPLEYGDVAVTFYGTESYMLLTASYRG
jgi:hypothetical protein